MDTHTLECLEFSQVREQVAARATCALGRGLALHMQPVTRGPLIRRWLDQVRELQALREVRGLPPTAGLSDVRETVRQCEPPLKVGVEELALLGDALAATHAVAQHLTALPESMPELRHLAERIGDFGTIAERFRNVIDERGRVRDEASPKLARIRREIAQTGEAIGAAVERLLRDPGVLRLLQYPNHTFHNDRLVVPLRTEYRGRLPGIVHRSSDSGATLYVEPAIAVELNNQISNLRSEESEEIARLLWELAHEVHLNRDAILKTLDTLAVLDLVIAKLRYADSFGLSCPEVVDEPTLSVRDARHPLLLALFRERAADGAADAVVPIDYRLGAEFDLLVITGPNTGGKTVTLKTIGLLTLMVQAGLPAPVGEGSRFGVFQEVLIDVGDEQSLHQSLSTFSGHLSRQLQMLRVAGPQSLILIDELGAGTDPDEGAAIGRALLEDLLQLKARCVVTTHIGVLKSFALIHERVENGCMEFDEHSMRPTFRLQLGQPGFSNALAIAERLGMPKRLVAAARGHLTRKTRSLHAAMEGTARVKREAETARNAAETARIDASRAIHAAEAERVRLRQQQQDFAAWVQRVVHLQPGDPVRVRDFDRDGTIVRVRLDQQRAEVDVGPFSVEAALGDLLPPATWTPPPRPTPAAQEPQLQDVGRRKQRGRGGDPRGERAGGPPGGPGPHGGAGRGPANAKPPDGGERRRERPAERPRAALEPLSDAQIAQLRSGDVVFVKRFHREGRIVRVKADKKVAVVNAGLLEVEVPFDGLAQVPPRGRE